MENFSSSRGRGAFELTVQLITAGAVFVGIYFVMVELRQGREISTVEMVHNRLITQIGHDARVYGENLAITLAKACHSPEELDNSEVIILNKYFETKMNQMGVAYTGAVIGSFQKGLGITENWQVLSERYVNEVLSYPSGRNWVKTHPLWSGDEQPLQFREMVAFVQSINVKPQFDCSDLRNRVNPPRALKRD